MRRLPPPPEQGQAPTPEQLEEFLERADPVMRAKYRLLVIAEEHSGPPRAVREHPLLFAVLASGLGLLLGRFAHPAGALRSGVALSARRLIFAWVAGTLLKSRPKSPGKRLSKMTGD